MKKILFFGILACSLAFYACKKDNTDDGGGDTEPPAKIDTVYLSDRALLGSKVKVAFGITRQGGIPAATTESGTPVLVENKNIVDAISGRYIVIKPSFSYYESTIKGYYVSIVGSGGHFEVNYAANRGFARQASQQPSLFREGDYVDSSIIVKLPKYIVGDTLSLTYAAYDSLGHISKHVFAHVRVHSQNGIADFQDFVGSWKVNRKTDANGAWQNYYIPDTSRTSFTCANGKVQYCLNGQNCFEGIAAITGVTKYDLMFTDMNEYSELFSATATRVILETSTCDKLAYGTQTLSKLEKGGWSFNPETKIMTIVVDNNGIEYPNFYSYQVKILEMTPQQVTLVRLDNTSYTVELVKK